MPDENSRNSHGKFISNHNIDPDAVYEAMDPLEPYTTRELADKVDAPRRTVLNYLDELWESGRIRKKKPEPRRAIWIRKR